MLIYNKYLYPECYLKIRIKDSLNKKLDQGRAVFSGAKMGQMGLLFPRGAEGAGKA